jgi:hypothetical protein
MCGRKNGLRWLRLNLWLRLSRWLRLNLWLRRLDLWLQ